MIPRLAPLQPQSCNLHPLFQHPPPPPLSHSSDSKFHPPPPPPRPSSIQPFNSHSTPPTIIPSFNPLPPLLPPPHTDEFPTAPSSRTADPLRGRAGAPREPRVGRGRHLTSIRQLVKSAADDDDARALAADRSLQLDCKPARPECVAGSESTEAPDEAASRTDGHRGSGANQV